MDPKIEDEEEQQGHVPRSTRIIFWILVAYMVVTLLGFIYFALNTQSALARLLQPTTSSNLVETGLDLPICVARTNRTGLRRTTLENLYRGRVSGVIGDMSSQSAKFKASVTLDVGGDFYTYYFTPEELQRTTLFDSTDYTEYKRTLDPLKIGDSIEIKETHNLMRPPTDSKTKIEIEKF